MNKKDHKKVISKAKKLFQNPLLVLIILLLALIAISSEGATDFFTTLGATALIIVVGVIICVPITLGIYALIAKCVVKAAVALGKPLLGQILGDAFRALANKRNSNNNS